MISSDARSDPGVRRPAAAAEHHPHRVDPAGAVEPALALRLVGLPPEQPDADRADQQRPEDRAASEHRLEQQDRAEAERRERDRRAQVAQSADPARGGGRRGWRSRSPVLRSRSGRRRAASTTGRRRGRPRTRPGTRPRTNPARTQSTGSPRCRARPADTPPKIGSCVSRVARRPPSGTGTSAVAWLLLISAQSSHSAGPRTMRADPDPTLRRAPPDPPRIRAVPDGPTPRRASGLEHDHHPARSTPTAARPRPEPPAPASPATRSATWAGCAASRSDRKVAGVAGGLARHLDIDPLILRVAFVVLVFFGGAGLILYGAGWLLVPEDGAERRHRQPRRAHAHRRTGRGRRARGARAGRRLLGRASGSRGRSR